jgi:hypothetical protein
MLSRLNSARVGRSRLAPKCRRAGPRFRGPSLFIYVGSLLPGIRAHRKDTRGIAGMVTVIKASLVGSALMLLAGCTGYLTNYQTPCVQGHVCDCRQYTTINRSWLDCRDYGRVKSKLY